MGFNALGLAAAYEGANAASDNNALQDRLAAQEKRAEQDQDFAQQMRAQQMKQINIANTNRDKNLSDMADIKAKYDAISTQSQSAQQSQDPTQQGQGTSQQPAGQTLIKNGFGLQSQPNTNVVSPKATDGSGSSSASASGSGSSASTSTPKAPDPVTSVDSALSNLGATGTGAAGTSPAGTPAPAPASAPASTPDPSTVPSTAPITTPAVSQAQVAVDQAAAATQGGAAPDPSTVPATPPAAVAPVQAPAPTLAAGSLTNAAQQSANAQQQPSQQQGVITPTGVPQRHNFNTTLDQQLELLSRQSTDGRISPADYAVAVRNINQMKMEGVHDALDLLAQGQDQEAIDRYNNVGLKQGMQILGSKEGTTTVNGVEQPTRFVTVRNGDGSEVTVDVTKARYQLLNAQQQMELADKAANTASVTKYHTYLADAQTEWHKDQATNQAERNRIELLHEQNEEKKLAQMQNVPLWSDKADARIDKLYTQPDPTTGQPVFDPTGAIFAKQVGLARARSNGGDIMSGLDYAYQTDAALKKAAGNDAGKLAELRAGYLQKISQQPPAAAPAGAPAPAPAAPAAPALSGSDPDSPYYKDANGNPTGDGMGLVGVSRDQIMAWQPKDSQGMSDKQAMLNQLDRQAASDKRMATPGAGNAPAKPAAPAAPGTAPGTPAASLTAPGGVVPTLTPALKAKAIQEISEVDKGSRTSYSPDVQAYYAGGKVDPGMPPLLTPEMKAQLYKEQMEMVANQNPRMDFSPNVKAYNKAKSDAWWAAKQEDSQAWLKADNERRARLRKLGQPSI